MKTTVKIVSLILFLVVLVSCSSTPTYEKSYGFNGNEWPQNVKPSFTVEIKDTTKEYNFVLTLRTTTEYKYSNLWIYMSTSTPDGQKAREPFEIKITNPDGTWAGKKTGTIVENSIYFRKRKLPKPGKYVFQLEQGITNSFVDEVLDVGLLVEEVVAP